MHGQKRSEYKARLLHPDTRVKLGSKAKQWNHLSDELLKQRRRLFRPSDDDEHQMISGAEDEANDATGCSASPSPEVLLALTEKMLSVNPDPSHLWNIRREMLVHILQSSETQPTAVQNDTTTISTDTADNNKEEEKDVAVEGSRGLQNSATVLDIQGELKLTAHCLQRNPKAYSTWFHRKWALVYYMTGSSSISSHSDEQGSRHWTDMKSILASELELCGQFLQLDERNFHCWNFRRFVVGLLGSCGGSAISTDDNEAHDSTATNFSGDWSWWVQDGDNEVLMMGPQISENACSAVGTGKRCDRTMSTVNKPSYPLSTQELEKIIMNEWDFTTSKIQDNFSNGSAFHYRSKLLPLILKFRSSPSSSRHEAISLVRDEWDNILLDAIFTEPDDQTVWFYHRFIVAWAMRNIANVGNSEDNAEVLEEYEGLLYDMVDSIQELIDVEKEDSLQGNDESRHESKGAKCKWAFLGMHLVLSTLMELKLNNSCEENNEESLELHDRASDCLDELIIIDPDRRERYQILKSVLK